MPSAVGASAAATAAVIMAATAARIANRAAPLRWDL
jgi:hypothetical protein